MSRFGESSKAREGVAGRDATDPRVLLALWRYAISRGVGSAREIARLCQEHAAYRWICGGVSVNYHTLSDFRSTQQAAREHAVREQEQRCAQALAQFEQLSAHKAQAKNHPQRATEVRLSTADPQARAMKMADGGYMNFAAVERAAAHGVESFVPPRANRTYHIDPLTPQPNDSPAIAAYRQRMASPEGRELYKQRAATAETLKR